MRWKRPEIGTKMYSVHEHLYYQKDKRTAPFMEYIVVEGEVTDFFTGGYTEVCLRGVNGDGHQFPYRRKLSDVGVKLFYTAKEAAMLAKQMTERYENTWAWMLDEPLRRTYEVYL